MAEPRKVPFVTISSFNTSPPTPESSKKRRREDEAVEITFGKDGGGGGGGSSVPVVGSGGGGGSAPFGNAKGGDAEPEEAKPTVRLNLPLTEPNERASAEFNYGELVNSSLITQVRRRAEQAASCARRRGPVTGHHLTTNRASLPTVLGAVRLICTLIRHVVINFKSLLSSDNSV